MKSLFPKGSAGWRLLAFLLAARCVLGLAAQSPFESVNPFIGTTAYGTCNPGAVCPHGLMSAVPYNVVGVEENPFNQDRQWCSTPYDHRNAYFAGYSHVNLSGVGCPDLGSLLLMPTMGDSLEVDIRRYGSAYTDEVAQPGYYANRLLKYGIRTEVTATPRTARARFTFPAGQAHLLLNLGQGLTNESGATVRWTGPNELEGVKLMGTFCYDARQAVFPLYFVVRIHRTEGRSGYWKWQRPKAGVAGQWDADNGRYKIYSQYRRELSGDDVGAWYSFRAAEGEAVEVSIGVSLVDIEGARRNLEAEQGRRTFDELRAEARRRWEDDLGRIRVEGGTKAQRTVFYTALYHLLLHPNVLQDVDGRYPAYETDSVGRTDRNRYTVFSLWDTYRTVHPLLCLLFPERQADMVRSLLGMYREGGRLPRWELYGRETRTMEGDPALCMVADTWLRGVRSFDAELAYLALREAAMEREGESLIRPDNDDYRGLGFVPLRADFDNSVSHALEYMQADFALSQFAAALGHAADAHYFARCARNYRRYYSAESGTLRPLLPDGRFLSPFDPRQGENFAPCPGFHEGSAWNYTFAVPYDVLGLARLMGGERAFVDKLQRVFDQGFFDPTNEPDLGYPYLFSFFPCEAHRTQQLTRQLLRQYYTDQPAGLPGNEDTGTLSAWAIYSMLGFYPYCPGRPEYVLTSPVFSRVSIRLHPDYYAADSLVIEAQPATASAADSPDSLCYIRSVRLGSRPLKRLFIDHATLTSGLPLRFTLSDKPAK